jgi:hypothetical protein
MKKERERFEGIRRNHEESYLACKYARQTLQYDIMEFANIRRNKRTFQLNKFLQKVNILVEHKFYSLSFYLF